MFPQLYVLFAALHIVSSQLNGEFWWLSNKLAGIRKVEPPPPKFDNTNEFETDESVKVVFRDNKEYFDEQETPLNKNFISNKDLKWTSIIFRDDSKLGKPIDVSSDIKVNNEIAPEDKITQMNSGILNSTKPLENKLEDVFEFVFPESGENSNRWVKKSKEKKRKETVTSPPSQNEKKPNKISINDKIWFENSNTNNLDETESICTFMKNRECIQNKGTVHMTREIKCPKQSMENKKVCCILPLPTEVSSKLKYPEPVEESPKRYKRSATTENVSLALKQRNALLERKFVTIPIVKPTASAAQTKVTQKIVSPDENVDPYWNVKNMKFRRPIATSSASQNTRYDYSNQDYDDYTVELPKPGLVGLYSDTEASQTTWKLSNKNGFSYGADSVSEEDDDDGIAFGYSSFDPRRGSRKSSTSPKPVKKRPLKVAISSEESQQSSEPISFKSNPNFGVLEGFKLLNLAKNNNRHVRTPESNSNENSYEESNTQPCSLMKPSNEYEDLVDQDQQVYNKCGKNVRKYSGDIDIDIAEEGFDPWLALVMRTKSHQKILCYATIVHPSAAVSAADCVSGAAPGELSVLVGVWDLSNERSKSQQRLCTVHAHSLFDSDLHNNIALLHWKRPLRLDVNIQPACIADPHVGDECYFVGWGGYDQAMGKSSRRQKATILTPRKCTERISKPDITLPSDSFCASVAGRGTVTGVGGPLLCRSGDRTSMVGLAVWREDVVVLLPVLQWVATTLPGVLQI